MPNYESLRAGIAKKEKGVLNMTADAKVGLLLGLVFIVIIAFLINGLPRVLDAENRNPSASLQPDSTAPDLELAPGVQRAMAPINDPVPLRSTTTPPPTRMVEVPDQVINPESAEDAETKTPDASQTPLPAKKQPKSYIVKSGDSLGKIAIAIYGELLGNKTEVVDKIFQANKDKLDDPDHVNVGDELTIPDLFEKVDEPTQAADTSNPAPSLLERILKPKQKTQKPKYKTYTVKEDDSLWQIAEEKLGNGNRYSEILELNKDKIKNASQISEGVVIKLPQR